TGPDCISNRILRNLADVLAAPICAIINSSIREGIIPEYWKLARITPLPKCFPAYTVENDVRPIAITSSISKIAELFINRWFNEHFQPHLDNNQFGCTADRSTTHALLKLTDRWFQASDKSSNVSRVLFVDFSKAFDLIDHSVLLQKFIDYQFPPHLTVWSLSFLRDRQQFVQIGNIKSNTQYSNSGTPQGTVSGPNDFKLLINDLTFMADYAKFVDDTTISSVSDDPYDDSLQKEAVHLCSWTH